MTFKVKMLPSPQKSRQKKNNKNKSSSRQYDLFIGQPIQSFIE